MSGELLALGAALCFSAASIFARQGSDHISRAAGLAVSLATNAIVLTVVAAIYLIVSGPPALSAAGIGLFALGGVFGTLVGRWAAIGSVHRLGPSRASMYKNMQPVLTTVLAIGVLNETFTARDLLGGGIVIAGILLLSAERARDEHVGEIWRVQAGSKRQGILLGLLAATGFALGNVVRKVGVEIWPEPILGAMIGVSVALTASVLTGGMRGVTLRRSKFGRGHVYFALFGLAGAGAQLLFFTSLVLIPVWIANVFVSMEPLLTIALSAVLLRGREHFGAITLSSAVLVMGGGLLIVL